MRTVTVNVFGFDELNDKAKAKAMETYFENNEPSCCYDFLDTINALEKIRNRIKEMNDDEIVDLADYCKYAGDDWPFTGTYADETAASYLWTFIHGKARKDEVSQAIGKAIARTEFSMGREYYHELDDDEAFADMADDNGWLYFEDGTLYHA